MYSKNIILSLATIYFYCVYNKTNKVKNNFVSCRRPHIKLLKYLSVIYVNLKFNVSIYCYLLSLK